MTVVPTEGAICEGTLRPQDLMRAFSDELARYDHPGDKSLIVEARQCAAAFDDETMPRVFTENASFVLDQLTDRLSEIADFYSLTFGTQEGDGACFGFWTD